MRQGHEVYNCFAVILCMTAIDIDEVMIEWETAVQATWNILQHQIFEYLPWNEENSIHNKKECNSSQFVNHALCKHRQQMYNKKCHNAAGEYNQRDEEEKLIPPKEISLCRMGHAVSVADPGIIYVAGVATIAH